jgi:lysophospholipase L1-like esterase
MNARGAWRRGLAAGMWLLVGAVAAAAGPPPDLKPAPVGEVYVSLGGFLADGDGASDEETTAYPAVLSKSYLEPAAGKAVQLVDLGKDEGASDTVAKFIGDYRTNPNSSSSLAKGIKALAAAKAQGQRVSPITVELGGEDIFNLAAADPAAQAAGLAKLRDQLAFILDELVDAVSDTDGRRAGQVILLTYYNPLPDVPELGTLSAGLNALIRKMARTRGLGVADVDRAFAGRESELLDGLNPNDDGHQVIAAEIWKATGLANPTAGG